VPSGCASRLRGGWSSRPSRANAACRCPGLQPAVIDARSPMTRSAPLRRLLHHQRELRRGGKAWRSPDRAAMEKVPPGRDGGWGCGQVHLILASSSVSQCAPRSITDSRQQTEQARSQQTRKWPRWQAVGRAGLPGEALSRRCGYLLMRADQPHAGAGRQQLCRAPAYDMPDRPRSANSSAASERALSARARLSSLREIRAARVLSTKLTLTLK
jgi:hypothetical protein